MLLRVSVIAIIMAVVIVVAGSAAAIFDAGRLILPAVILHNAGGIRLGYGWPSFQAVHRQPTHHADRGRHVELWPGLVKQFLLPEAALPGTVFSVWHNLSGALIDAYWHRISAQKTLVLEEVELGSK